MVESKHEKSDSMKADAPWKAVPRRSTIIFPLAVFFTFATVAFANDIIDLGHQPPIRFALSVVLSGLFAAAYALTGISLRGRFWKPFFPLLALQILVMYLLGNWFPDMPHTALISVTEMARMQARLGFDGVASIIAICLGYAGFVYVSISEARRYSRGQAEMSRQQAVLESELAAAREVQQVLVPKEIPNTPGFEVHSVYQPAGQVGGDFFQIIPLDSGAVLIAIGDVSGKGMPAAMTVSLLVGTLRTLAHYTHDPGEILAAMNQRMLDRASGGFTTCLLLRTDQDGSIITANAGHLAPYLDGEEVEIENGLPLGLSAESSYPETAFTLNAGEQLTLITDGVLEARAKGGELFGFARTQAISRQGADQIAKTAQEFGQDDDITVLTVIRAESLAGVPAIDILALQKCPIYDWE
jgi:hypothetical protein